MKQSICSLKRASDEIEEALDTICESHDLALARVWIDYENEYHVPFSSSVKGTQTKQMFADKLVGFCEFSDENCLFPLQDYSDTCDTIPLRMGEGIVGKTFQTYEPHFCRDVYKLSENGILPVLCANTRCSCFVICLRSIDTGELDYAFEFVWDRNRNYFMVLDSLLSTLKRCLPNFKFASGAENW